MHRSSLFAVLFCAAALGMARVPPQGGTMSDSVDLKASGPAQSSWQGGQCGMSKPAVRTISSDADWSALWREAFRQEAPKVDFGKYFAVAVFLGARPTGGFSVEFPPPLRDEGVIVIPYRVLAPGKSSFVIQAFTSPYGIQLYRRIDEPVSIREIR